MKDAHQVVEVLIKLRHYFLSFPSDGEKAEQELVDEIDDLGTVLLQDNSLYLLIHPQQGRNSKRLFLDGYLLGLEGLVK